MCVCSKARARLAQGTALAAALLLGLACGGAKQAPASPVTIVTQTVAATRTTETVPATAAGAPATRGAATAPFSTAGPTAQRTSTTGFGRAPAGSTASSSDGLTPSGFPVRSPGAAASCVDTVFNGLTPAQRVGQLFMVGLNSGEPRSAATAAAITNAHAGNVVLFGNGWNGMAMVQQTTDWLQGLATSDATGGVKLFISGNQEGGQPGSLRAFYGAGFDPIPSALQQGQMTGDALQAAATKWGQQLGEAGVNLNLAPVLDTVDRANVAANAPIGALDREYGYTPDVAAAKGVAFIKGMHAAREAVTIKHFPGLGRVTGNTDFTAQGITDSVTSESDQYLSPYQAGIQAGAEFVMVALASYTRIDPGVPAVFSGKIISDLLRGKLQFGGVIVSDDMGAAVAVAGYAPAERARKFFAAGGDMVLTIQPADIEPMAGAVMQQMQADPAFRQSIEASVRRVLSAKANAGLLRC